VCPEALVSAPEDISAAHAVESMSFQGEARFRATSERETSSRWFVPSCFAPWQQSSQQGRHGCVEWCQW